jgi:orotidine-5'-phosphate decarboxylase
MKAKDRIIFALDIPDEDAAKRCIQRLANEVGLFKIGLELFVQAGPGIVRFIRQQGAAGVFLDLKLHDIPATVRRTMARIADLGADMATVHCGENPAMLEAAVAGSSGRLRVLGVTVLTSVSAPDIRAAGFRKEYAEDLSKLVIKRAGAARAAGCAGVICSPLEVGAIKQHFGAGFLAVTPGIRPSSGGVHGDDQQRISTPGAAIDSGADYLVVGRPIRDAVDPVFAAAAIAEEIRAALS